MDSDDIAMFDPEIVSDDSVDAGRAIVKVIIGENDENGVFTLFALDEDGVSSEKLERLHGVVGKSNDGVVIICGISHTVSLLVDEVEGYGC